jgi:asparagine synthase (glutamine-hydrolysing)
VGELFVGLHLLYKAITVYYKYKFNFINGMCGIKFTILPASVVDPCDRLDRPANLQANWLARRGPTAHYTHRYNDLTHQYTADFYHLSLVGATPQPYQSESAVLMCNGEIYNYKELEAKYKTPICSSDCEILMWLLDTHDILSVLPMLSGEFAFVFHDLKRQLVHFGTDRVGRKPLYYSATVKGRWSVSSRASECITTDLDQGGHPAARLYKKRPQVYQCKPGMLYTLDLQTFTVSQIKWHTFQMLTTMSMGDAAIYRLFMQAVRRRITQRNPMEPVGFMLSGGFDSCTVLSAALAIVQDEKLNFVPEVFTVGFSETAPDVVDAGRIVEWMREKYGSKSLVWHRVIYSTDEAIAEIPAVIAALETYDTTTIRASIPMYMLSRYIAEKTQCKIILSGEGSDELFGGYQYFQHAPNEYAVHAEIIKLLGELYLYDALRADRSTAAFGLEVRTPFLDDEFVAAVLQCKILGPHGRLTKLFIRRVMAHTDLLPDFILHGKKEAFSDGVGHVWKTRIKEYAEQTVRGDMWGLSPYVICDTREAQMFQEIFKTILFEQWHLCEKLWLPNQDWINTGSEPSATVLPSYTAE